MLKNQQQLKEWCLDKVENRVNTVFYAHKYFFLPYQSE